MERDVIGKKKSHLCNSKITLLEFMEGELHVLDVKLQIIEVIGFWIKREEKQ